MAKFENGLLIVQNGLGYEELAVSSSPVGLLDIPERDRTRRIVIQTDGQPVRWLAFPGANVVITSSAGLKLGDDDILVYDGEPADLYFVLDGAATGDTTLLIHYFGA